MNHIICPAFIYIKKAIRVRNGFIIDLGAWLVLSRFLFVVVILVIFGVAEESQKAGRARLCRSKEKGVAWRQGAGRSRRKQFDLQRQRYEGLKINMNNEGIKNGAQPLHLVRLVRKCPNIPAPCSNPYYLYLLPTCKPKVCYFELLACSLPMKGFLSLGALEIPNHQQVISPLSV